MTAHTMTLAETYPTGAVRFLCPACGREFVVAPLPPCPRVMLCDGDETAVHSGGTGGVVMGEMSVKPGSDLDAWIDEIERGLE